MGKIKVVHEKERVKGYFAKRHKSQWHVKGHYVKRNHKKIYIRPHTVHANVKKYHVKPKVEHITTLRFKKGGFKALANKVAREYEKKGVPRAKAIEWGRGTAAKIYRMKLAKQRSKL